jgi:hypothetical protein
MGGGRDRRSPDALLLWARFPRAAGESPAVPTDPPREEQRHNAESATNESADRRPTSRADAYASSTAAPS